MASDDPGRWEPLDIASTVEMLRPATFRWWISGCRALELHLGRSWREHGDTDVGLSRPDAPKLRLLLDGWDIQVASAGTLTAWTGDDLAPERHQNNLWCRRVATGPWLLDVTVGEGDDENWIYRRDPDFRVPWVQAVLWTEHGVPYLAPELQLLFKSKQPRAKDELDARQVIPALGADRRARLARQMPGEHPWQKLIGPPSDA